MHLAPGQDGRDALIRGAACRRGERPSDVPSATGLGETGADLPPEGRHRADGFDP